MIGGETWPAIARAVRAGEGGDAARAVAVLVRGRNTESLPDVVTPEMWQHLLQAVRESDAPRVASAPPFAFTA